MAYPILFYEKNREFFFSNHRPLIFYRVLSIRAKQRNAKSADAVWKFAAPSDKACYGAIA